MSLKLVKKTAELPVISRQRVWNVFPTTVPQSQLFQALCIGLLGSSADEAEELFQWTFEKLRKVFVPSAARIVKARERGEICGVDLVDSKIRIGSPEKITSWIREQRGSLSAAAKTVLSDLELEEGAQVFMISNESSDLGMIVGRELRHGPLTFRPASDLQTL